MDWDIHNEARKNAPRQPNNGWQRPMNVSKAPLELIPGQDCAHIETQMNMKIQS